MKPFPFKHRTPIDLLNVDIQGERVRLVSLAMDYDTDIFREFTPEITRYMTPKSADKIEETHAFIQGSRASMKEGHNLQLAILLAETGEFLGCCGLHGREEMRKPELGIWLKKGAHGHGYGREAITTLVHWANENLDLDSFIYPVDKANTASRKIPESLGGKVVREVKVKALTGHILDEVIYEIPV